MSWSWPVTGATPHQQPQYVNHQSSFSQPQSYQHGQQSTYGQIPACQPFPQSNALQRPLETRPPKKKGNTIITRYPPPPGYRGLGQPQGAFGAQQHPQQYSGQLQSQRGPPANGAYTAYGYSPSTSQAYPQNAPQNPYPSTGYPQPSAFSWSQQPHHGYAQHPHYSTSQSYVSSQSTYSGYHAQPPPVNSSQQAWTQPQGWTQPPISTSYSSKHQHTSAVGSASNTQPMVDPSSTTIPTPSYPTIPQRTPSVSQPQSSSNEQTSEQSTLLFSPSDDWDFDFDGAIWPKANEPVDPDFSLGVIIWHPAKQVTRALPSNFANAEEQALKPPPEKLGNGESVSLYFTAENSHEAFLDVRQTDEWDRIRNDPVFVVFTDEDMARNLIHIEECLALRDRPDEPIEEVMEEAEEAHEAAWNVMDHLEQALSGTSGEEERLTTERQNDFVKDQKQEDILAKLGVTGTPKPPSDDPMPFPFPAAKSPPSLPEKPPMTSSPSNTDRVRSEQSQQTTPLDSDPRNCLQGQHQHHPSASASNSFALLSHIQEYNPWNPTASSQNTVSPTQNHSRGDSACSSESNKTTVGPDFGSAKSPMQVAQLKGSDGSVTRKRSHGETDQEGQERQTNYHSKRIRLFQGDST